MMQFFDAVNKSKSVFFPLLSGNNVSHFEIKFAVVGIKACLGGCCVVMCLHEIHRFAACTKNPLQSTS